MPVLARTGLGAGSGRGELALGTGIGFGVDRYRPAPGRVGVAGVAGNRTCGSPDCTSSWVMPWKNRSRPIFEQEWGCSGRCLERLVRAAVRREQGDVTEAQPMEAHRHRVPLGLVLLAQGWITHPQLQAALAAQRASGEGRIGEWLAKGCGLGEEQITRGLGLQWSCPVLTLDGFSPAAMALVMPKRFVGEFGLIPLRVAGSSLLYMAFADQMDAATTLGVEQMSGLRVESGLLAQTQYEAARARVLEADGVPVTMSNAMDADEMIRGIVKTLEGRQPVAARLVRVHRYYWLRLWLESGAVGRTGTLPSGTSDVEDCLFTIGARKG